MPVAPRMRRQRRDIQRVAGPASLRTLGIVAAIAMPGLFVLYVARLDSAVGNVDLTLICEAPKIGPRRDAMRGKLAALLGVDIGRVSIKATTTERLGFAGRGEGIAAQAVATLVPFERT